MLPRPDAHSVPQAALSQVLAVGFGQRRKMLRKTLLPWLQIRGIDVSGLPETARAEEVPVAQWVELAHRVAAADRGLPS